MYDEGGNPGDHFTDIVCLGANDEVGGHNVSLYVIVCPKAKLVDEMVTMDITRNIPVIRSLIQSLHKEKDTMCPSA